MHAGDGSIPALSGPKDKGVGGNVAVGVQFVNPLGQCFFGFGMQEDGPAFCFLLHMPALNCDAVDHAASLKDVTQTKTQ